MIINFFKEYPLITAGITTSQFGNCSNNMNKTEIDLCHQKLLQQYQFNNITIAKLVHTSNILNIDKDDCTQVSDALITNKKNHLIAITTADCIPVFLFDPTTNTIGIIHSGRKGLKEKITLKCIEKMKQDYNISIANLQVQIGPHICKHCYEVGEDIVQEFNIQNHQNTEYLPMQDILVQELQQFGIPIHNIRQSSYCTYCSTDTNNQRLFFSYRNNGDTQRMLSFIGMK